MSGMEYRPGECKIIAFIGTCHKVLVFRSSEINNIKILVHGALNQTSIHFCLIRFTCSSPMTRIERSKDFRSDECEKRAFLRTYHKFLVLRCSEKKNLSIFVHGDPTSIGVKNPHLFYKHPVST